MEFKISYLGTTISAERIVEIPKASWRYQRPVVKLSKCTQCGWCYLFCPQGCLVDKGNHFEADLDFCKGCGVCANVCPVNAITMVEER